MTSNMVRESSPLKMVGFTTEVGKMVRDMERHLKNGTMGVISKAFIKTMLNVVREKSLFAMEVTILVIFSMI